MDTLNVPEVIGNNCKYKDFGEFAKYQHDWNQTVTRLFGENGISIETKRKILFKNCMRLSMYSRIFKTISTEIASKNLELKNLTLEGDEKLY